MNLTVVLKILIIITSTLFIPASNGLAASLRNAEVPPPVARDLKTVLSLYDSGKEAGFEAARIPALMKFVSASKPASILYAAKDGSNTNSAYHEFDIDTGFTDFLKIAFNPDVPSYLLMPTSVRRSHWKSVNGTHQPLPKLWQNLPDLTAAITVRGVEFVENTPDIFSGAYFAYDLGRMLILLKHEGRFVLLSVSKQASISRVGKKGVILGPDEDWNYLYSGQNGINRPGLGWVSSYMYDSYAVAVYAQLESGRPGVRCATFKWVNAGWSKINMVKKEHIYRGLLRYGKTFKEIIESPILPGVDKIAATYARIRGYSFARLKDKFYSYLNTLEARHRNDDNFPQRWFKKWFKSKNYLSQLKKEELESVLFVEFLKNTLGRRPEIDIGDILGSLPATADAPALRLAYNE